MEFLSKLDSINIKKEKLNIICKKFNLSENLVKLLFSRGIKTEEEIKNFLEPSVNTLYNPFALTNMQQLVNRINLAMKNNEKVVIVGDYDTDGICATTILLKYFQSKNFKVDYFLPNRFVDGYSLTKETVDKIKQQFNPNLIITVDCGISCYSEVEYAKLLNIEIIVTDHHEIPEQIPNTIVVDPKLETNSYPFRNLCGAGVALKVVQALGGMYEALKYVNIASLATVADIVPLIDENRTIVHLGLKQTNELPLGVKKLIKSCGIKELTASDIAFKLAPKINTAGRLKDANLAFELFVNNNEKELGNYLKELLKLNDERINLCNKIADEAFDMLKNVNISEKRIIVLQNESWDSGVLGIVCSKLVEKFNRPVCLLGKCQNEYKGSVRSIDNVDIFKCLTYAKDLMIRFGGHSQAGGLSIEQKNIVEFEKRLEEYLFNNYDDKDFVCKKYYDFDFSKQEINSQFLDELKLLEPFGFGNEKPIIKISLNNTKVQRMKNYYNHIKLKYNNVEIVGFNMGDYCEQINSNCLTEMLIDISEEIYAGKKSIKGIIKNIKCYPALGSIKKEVSMASSISVLGQNTVNNNLTIKNIDLECFINENINKCFGTVFITNNFDNYIYILKNSKGIIKNFELYNIINASGLNTLLYAPIFNLCSINNLKNYTNIIFLENPIINSFSQELINKNIYFANLNNNLKLTEINGSRKDIIKVFNALKHIQNTQFNTLFNCYSYVFKNLNLKVKFCDFVFALIVLKEIDIININLSDFTITITNNKSNLETSTAFNIINKINN